MVLCKFFQQGSCRFGSKCVNEHLDIKQMIKADVEAATHGKQWPLSSYGPFRDKPSIPNFIEDQSFEEVRMLCYEAKQKNFFEQFHQQFTKEVMEASNKMNALLQMTPDIVDVLTKVYDVPSDTSSFGAAVGKSTNNASNPFGFPDKSTFHAPQAGFYPYSPAVAPQQQTSIFAQAPKATSSIFGVGTQQNTSIFGQQQNSSNIFAVSSQQQQATNSNGLFSQQNQFVQPSQISSNIFRQAMQSSQPQSQQGLFTQAAQTIQQQVQPQQGLFSQADQQASASQNLFASATQQTPNIFGQALQQHMLQQNLPNLASQQQQTNSNIFQQNQNVTNSQQIQNHETQAVGFQQTALQIQNPTEVVNNLSQPISTLYSRLEDLTSDEIEAFKADCFLPGKIPFNPPPRELIN